MQQAYWCVLALSSAALSSLGLSGSAEVPEPVTVMLCGISLVMMGLLRRFPTDLT